MMMIMTVCLYFTKSMISQFYCAQSCRAYAMHINYSTLCVCFCAYRVLGLNINGSVWGRG